MKTPVVIEQPILNSAFAEPKRHFRFDDDGITNEVIDIRRPSSYFVPIAKSRRKGGQVALPGDWTEDRIEENELVNRIRQRVALWRTGGYVGVTPTTRKLLEYWTNEERERKLFFCQIEALETAIYIAEAAKHYDPWIETKLREANDTSNPGLPRIALKMATGSGKTVVMAMLIAWQCLNKLSAPNDRRFSDTFLIVCPGITIRDRLRVLKPEEPDNYYRERDLLPGWQLDQLQRANILITNFHAFLPREKQKASKTTKQILGNENVFTETQDEVVRRVCREISGKKNIVVINDEAHHCYRRKPDDVKLKGDERKESEQREEEARIWISGIEAVQQKLGVRTIYDLSATPFFLRGSGYSEGTLFPWVVSDFSLVDAIESGVVKVPRVPVDDNVMASSGPTYRELWPNIREHLPKKGRGKEKLEGPPDLPSELEGALRSLYANYDKAFQRWETADKERHGGSTPPVFIVVCNNTNTSNLVYRWIAGWERTADEITRVQAGKLDLFRNDDGQGGWLHRPNTILVDSQQLESGDALSKDFQEVASREIEEFKVEYERRFPGRDADSLTSSDILREVMNTVGKQGQLGEHVRCVVSVSMLTEGWDANTVTHVLGVRAFGTQLLCEQVVGRALRRMSYVADEHDMFQAEYAEVYGVPFSFIPSNGGVVDPRPARPITRVRAMADRAECEITFPRVAGYRFEIPDAPLTATFTEDHHIALGVEGVPTWTEMAPIAGLAERHEIDRSTRFNEVAYQIADTLLNRYFREFDPDTKSLNQRPWRFPQLLEITKRWMRECVHLKDDGYYGRLLFGQDLYRAAEMIHRAISQGEQIAPRILPVLQPYDTIGSTRYVSFDTTKPTYVTDPYKCHISHVVADTASWEQKMAQVLEEMPEVIRYCKNEGMDFMIPYEHEGVERQYKPDFIACIDDSNGDHNLLNLVIEVTGKRLDDKRAKVDTAQHFWIPAVNNHGGFGRWGVVQILDPMDARNTIRGYLDSRTFKPAAD